MPEEGFHARTHYCKKGRKGIDKIRRQKSVEIPARTGQRKGRQKSFGKKSERNHCEKIHKMNEKNVKTEAGRASRLLFSETGKIILLI